jgi:hypothetical protein
MSAPGTCRNGAVHRHIVEHVSCIAKLVHRVLAIEVILLTVTGSGPEKRAVTLPKRDHKNLELGTLTLWIIGAAFLAAGSLLIGYSLGLKAGERKSNLAKDLRILRKEEQIARLEKALANDTSSQPYNDGDSD